MLILRYLENGERKETACEQVTFERDCDVLCVGVGAAGGYAALAAAREGVRVIALERDDNIGGTPVIGRVSGYYYGFDGGSYQSVDRACRADAELFAEAPGYPDARQIHLAEKLAEYGVTLLCGCTVTGIRFCGNTAVGVEVFDGERTFSIACTQLIDATADGHLIRMCPVQTFLGREPDHKTMPFTVRSDYLDGASYRSANGDSGYCDPYQPRAFSEKILYAHAGTASFLKKDGVRFLGAAALTGIREGLRYEGEQMLSYRDLLLDTPPEKVLFYAYSDLDKHGHDLAADRELYQNWWCISNLSTVTMRIPVPFGSVVPKGLCGIVSAGRCFSADHYAASAVRMNRDMFRMGECVGIGCALAMQEKTDFLHINYDKYLCKVNEYRCYAGDESKKYGFAYPAKPEKYTPVDFHMTDGEILERLATETPGTAVWACFLVSEDHSDSGEKRAEALCAALARAMNTAEEMLFRYNCAIALGIMKRAEALPVLREIVRARDCFYFKDCRRSNQFRSAVALCLLGRIGEREDTALLESILFDESEYERALYHTLQPDYLYYSGSPCNFVYFQIFTHAAAAYVRLLRRFGTDGETLRRLIDEKFGSRRERIIRNVTPGAPDSPAYIEIADFLDVLLYEIR